MKYVLLLGVFLMGCSNLKPVELDLNEFTTYTDKESKDSTNSIKKFTVKDGILNFKAEVPQTLYNQFPYAGIKYDMKHRLKDLTKFKSLVLVLDKEQTSDNIRVLLHNEVTISPSVKLAPFEYVINTHSDTVIIPLNDFKIAPWWYTLNSLSQEDLDITLDNVQSLSIENFAPNKNFEMHIKSISLSKIYIDL